MAITGTDFRRHADGSHDELVWALYGDEGAVTWTVLAFPAGTANLGTAARLGRVIAHDDTDYVVDVLFAHRPDPLGVDNCPWVQPCKVDAYLESHNRAVFAEWAHHGFTDATVFAALRRIYIRDLLAPAGAVA